MNITIQLMPDNIYNVVDSAGNVIGEYDAGEWTEDEIRALFDEEE